jgi:hypothetical protein
LGQRPLSRGRHLPWPGRFRIQRSGSPVRFCGLGFAYRGPPSNAPDHGEWGLASRWSPQWLDGTLGFYYRNFADKLPQTFITKVGANSASRYNLIYADNIDLWGVSLAKNIGGISLGAEASYRHNTPLNSQVLGIAPGLPAEGDTKGPRGDTYHALANALGVVPQNPLFDTASWSAELTWASWQRSTAARTCSSRKATRRARARTLAMAARRRTTRA